jgi:pyruvate,water dikinase
VGGHVTPDSFTVDKRTGAILSQRIADKEVMTVRLAEGTREEPVPAAQRRQAALQPPQVAELARLGARIEQLYGQPMDIEWAVRDGRIFILQARPITALPEARPAIEWILPRERGSYGRSSVIELLPEPLSPLFATLGLPMWNEASRDLLQSLGFADFFPPQLLLTINDYAYYDFSFQFGVYKVARFLLTLPRLLPRGIGLIRRARTRWADEARPRYAAVVAEWVARDPMAIPAAQLLDAAREIAKAAAEHYLVVQSGVLPAAYISETLFTSAYNRVVRRKGDPPALTFVLGFDSAPIHSEKSLYDLAMWARTQPALAEYLTQTSSREIVAACQTAGAPTADTAGWREFSRRLAEHLNRFGHSIYDLDFAKSLPADDPAPLLEALKYFLSGRARDPHDRQAGAAAARKRATEALLARLKGIRLRFFRWILPMAQRFAPLREDALADVGLGWPLLRRMLRELGRRLTAAGAIRACDDVFWLKLDEANEAALALNAGQPPQDYRGAVSERRATGERERAVTPPVVLPVKGGGRFLGIDFTGWMPARTSQAAGNTIKGIGASPGRVAGVARVIHGPDEFQQMRPGDILVAKITTPAWTPLFALASGVVTDVGGPLSHGSIVAREYHIPAVLGTGVATERIRSGQRITVDGDAGVVTVDG